MTQEYSVHIEIAPQVHLIRGANRARFPEANCLLIDDEILTLVDAGASLPHIERTLKDLGHEISDVDQIVLTHFHVDHKGYAERIRKVAHCDIVCHELGVEGTKSFEGLVDCYGTRGRAHYYAWESFIKKWLPHVTENYEVTGTFQDGEDIDCGNVKLIPIHTPGHTQDHTCIGINGRKVIYLVDIDLTRFGPWYGNAVSDIVQFKESIKRIMDMRPAMGISSHLMEPISNGLEDRLEAYLAVFDERDQRIVHNVEEGHDTIEKLAAVPTIYPRIPHEVYLVFEEIMLEKHVRLLCERGVLRRDGEKILVDKR
ncbi:MAG: hypothetical protein DRO73_00750 [Candidatus Thorarchaeota archaeon]|nr:MAG: hypothetical protein DRO73_00750 [Candidatus Thorarchaeota archaeon]